MNFRIIYPSELANILQKEPAMLIDVRSKEEYQKEHWPGAKNFAYEDVQHWERMLPGRQLIILYCEHGGSSMQLARRISLQGYRVASVVGGFEAMKNFLRKTGA
jgi:thiosulfate sulfurtransferase